MRLFLTKVLIFIGISSVLFSTSFVEAKTNEKDSGNSEVKTYHSKKLGVSFQYLASEGDPIIEEGNTIYVNGKEGQYVQKFKRKVGESLKIAVKKRFLAKAPKRCKVVDSQFKVRKGKAVEIANSKTNFEWDPRSEGACAGKYERTNGASYFWMDSADPTSLYFFSIGQYVISASKDRKLLWQDTVKVGK